MKGKNASFNASKILEIFKGEQNEFSEAVALNAAAGLIVSEKELVFKDAYNKAKKNLLSGNVFDHLTKLQQN